MNLDNIVIKKASVNNLKGIDVTIPRNKLVIITGLSGSGKSSLAFDTLYAEGQRRYVESLSSYARQFLGGLSKPDVESIEGLSPAIAIDQKTTSNNPRSTVGTVTEIYDYLRLLYARCGDIYCPKHKIKITGLSIKQMINFIYTYPLGSKIEILANVVTNRKGSFKELFSKLRRDGFLRLYIDDKMQYLEEVEELEKNKFHNIEVIVDRLVLKEDRETRLSDSLELALSLTEGTCLVKIGDKKELLSSKQACPSCGFTVPTLEPRFFSFNSPLGACDICKGLGITNDVDEEELIPDATKSIAQGGLRYFKNTVNTSNIEWQSFFALLKHYQISLTKPLSSFTKKEKDLIFNGSKEMISYEVISSGGICYRKKNYIEGLKSLILRRYNETSSSGAKEYYQSYLSEKVCSSCLGKRLSPKVLAVEVGGLNIAEFCEMNVEQALDFISNLILSPSNKVIADNLIKEIISRLTFLKNVGLTYLTLNRSSSSLSGGEAQRIRLATQIGSSLTGVIYVLDEPSIGLHQRDSARLFDTLKTLRNQGNSIIVVEHDLEMMANSDYLIDVGPGAGKDGGQIVACGTPNELKENMESLTGQYLAHKRYIEIPIKRRKGNGKFLTLVGASEHNLKKITAKFPLGTLICISGVSGSGKSTLVNDILVKVLQSKLYHSRVNPGKYTSLKGLENIDKIVAVSQEPIGRTPRSNPATYTGVFDDIRALFALVPASQERGYDKGRFSFNVSGGRCESCQGDGVKKISMLFVPDVYVECEECHGKRYNSETLKVTYHDKNIYDILKMNISEALTFFKDFPKIKQKLQILADVGLGYLELGQSSTTLSGGEAQRIKLASELQKKASGKTLFVLDEPTTGLHSEDIKHLLVIAQRLVNNGDTVLIIEHNLDVLKVADYIIDLGPEGGDNGGYIVAEGTPEQVSKVAASYTGQYLKNILEEKNAR